MQSQSQSYIHTNANAGMSQTRRALSSDALTEDERRLLDFYMGEIHNANLQINHLLRVQSEIRERIAQICFQNVAFTNSNTSNSNRSAAAQAPPSGDRPASPPPLPPGMKEDLKRAKEQGSAYDPRGAGAAWSHNFLKCGATAAAGCLRDGGRCPVPPFRWGVVALELTAQPVPLANTPCNPQPEAMAPHELSQPGVQQAQ